MYLKNAVGSTPTPRVFCKSAQEIGSTGVAVSLFEKSAQECDSRRLEVMRFVEDAHSFVRADSKRVRERGISVQGRGEEWAPANHGTYYQTTQYLSIYV